ncbi:DEAD/DEAH box helicase [Candidatus Solincola tengchongensis]|uniref:DEAD/DEAH box helicase n=1 Tax=Candidatus Solincola tengchongensis TaxID=2900693 RepID=UPI00257B7F5D|nr:DEAD/DEAH box helicase [Candidatus Solincola tengchongensis]
MERKREKDLIAEFTARYPFPLDDFQLQAIESLARDRSVLVVAPTGSGKTVVAEFAVWLAERQGGRTFYTTPLKALSNQKFRDFGDIYGPDAVGLLTGDNSINPQAPVVIMTTEVLRNMIYERSPDLYDLRYVVLDECHYLMDPFRGPVWEEIIIHLPTDIKIVALSATVSNYGEFGEWLNDLRGDVDVVYHDRRPVPLRHYYFIGGIMVNLLSDRAPGVVEEYERSMKGRGRDGRRPRTRHLIPRRADVVERLRKSGMLPAIYFIFSRAGCDAGVAHCLEEGADLTTPEEKRVIEEQALARVAWLPEEDLKVFGFDLWLEALKRGLASHHAGHLPIFKEIVEDLFAQGLVKVVFATETLSLGINMPAKTVVIESLFKFTGESHEFLTPTEYTQFTGRAGRRGIDKVGNAITLYNPMVPFSQVRRLAEMESLPITSSFSLSYNMVVNLLHYYDVETTVHMLNSSFAQFHADREVVRLERSRSRLAMRIQAHRRKIECQRGDPMAYLAARSEISRLEKEMAAERRRRRRELINRELEELVPGDVLVLHRRGSRRAAVVLSISEDKHGDPRLTALDDRGRLLKVSYQNFPYPPQVIGHLGKPFIPARSRAEEKKLRQALAGFRVPPPQEWEEEFHLPHREELIGLREELEGSPCHTCERREACLETCRSIRNLQTEMERVQRQMEARSDVSSRKLANVMRVLERLGYLEGEKPTPKGIVLSRIYNECDLILVECLEEGLFLPLDEAETAALASVFVFETREGPTPRRRGGRPYREPAQGPTVPTPALQEAILEARSLEGRIKALERREGLDLVRPLDPGFVPVVYDWATGEDLAYISSTYPQYSAGDFVRSMKQVLDILRQMKEVTEDPLLSEKFSGAMDRIHRSIVAYTSVVDVMEEELESGIPGR